MDVPEISAGEARARLASAPPPRLIDVREEDEWALARVEGAELVPLSRFTELAPQVLADRAQPLLMMCHHGVRSAHAAGWLINQGYADVTNVAGGIDAWSCEVDAGVPRY